MKKNRHRILGSAAAILFGVPAARAAEAVPAFEETQLAPQIVRRLFPDGKRTIVAAGTELADRTPPPDPVPDPDGAAPQQGFLLFRRPASDGVYRYSAPRAGERIERLSTILTPGETRHVQFAVYGRQDLGAVRVQAGPLRREAPAAGPRPGVSVHPVRLGLWRNYWDPFFTERGKLLGAAGDAVSVPAGESRQFWVLLRVPADTAPGTWRTELAVTTEHCGTTTVALDIRVLPFQLAEGMWWGIYYYANYHENTPRDLADMREHGVNSMLVCPPGQQEPVLRREGDRVLASFPITDKIMAELKGQGFRRPLAYFPRLLSCRILQLFGRVDDATFTAMSYYGQPAVRYRGADFPEDLKPVLMDVFRQMVDHAKAAEWPEILWYLVDEPRSGPDNPQFEWAQLEFALFRQACPLARTLCTAYNLDTMTALDPWVDVRVCDMWTLTGAEGNARMHDHARASGDQLWGIRWLCQYNTYLFPRYYAGFGAVKLGVAGMTEWTYYGAAGIGDGYDQLRSKEGCSYAYVDADGNLLSTVTWEGTREGITDGRYVATLRQLLDAARTSGTAPAEAAAAAAELDAILDRLPWGAGQLVPETELDECRNLLARAIVRLLDAGVTIPPRQEQQ